MTTDSAMSTPAQVDPAGEEHEPSAWERDMLRLLAAGLTAETAARQLDISARTLRRRMRALRVRLGVNTPTEVIVVAARRGWI